MPTIAYIIKNLAKQNVTVSPDASIPNHFTAQHKGYTLHFSTNAGDQNVCVMSAERTGIKDAGRTYRDTLKSLLKIVDVLAENIARDSFAALGNENQTPREELRSLKDDAGTITLQFPEGTPVEVDTVKGWKPGVSGAGWIQAEKHTAILVINFPDAKPLYVPFALLSTVRIAEGKAA